MATTLQVLTDVHAGSPSEGLYSNQKLGHLAYDLLSDILRAGQERGDIQGVLNLGDLIEHADSSFPENLRKEIDGENILKASQVFKELALPSLHCIGNHPVMSLSEQVITSAIGLDAPYYARDIGDHRIIMLHSRFSHRFDSPTHKSGSGIYIDDKQLTWLRKELETTDRKVLLCCHHPLSDQDLTGNIWFEKFPECALLQNRQSVQEILAQSGKVIAVLSGHTHWNYLCVDQSGIPHITLQSVIENFRGDGVPAATYGVVVLKDASFNLEIFGNDLALRGATINQEQIARDLARTYNSIADVYDAKTAQFGTAEQKQYDYLLELVKPDHCNKVVDFGCGPGRDVGTWRGRNFKYVGVDISEKFLEIARRRSPDESFICGDFTSVQLPKNSAAIVIHNSSLQHTPRASLDAALHKAFDTLEPGGIFYCHYRSGTGESLSISTEYGTPIARFIALYTEEEMEAALCRVGFDIIKSETYDHKYDGLKGKVVQYKTRTYARKPGT